MAQEETTKFLNELVGIRHWSRNEEDKWYKIMIIIETIDEDVWLKADKEVDILILKVKSINAK